MSKEPRTMFSITAKDGEWPGLGKVAEECSEAVTVVGKLMCTGGDINYWEGVDLRQRLIEELGDALAACEFAAKYNDILLPVMQRRKIKLDTFEKWRSSVG